jgi:4-aminobutyrate aminotransferase-like enzyme
MTDTPHLLSEIPGPRARAIREDIQRLFYPGLMEELSPIVAERKEDWTIVDVDGNRIADLASASASVPLGAGRQDILGPAIEALHRYGNEDCHAVASTLMVPLAQRLIELAPASLTRVDLALNGTEAVETALKFMRRATGRPLVFGFYGGYHGETTAAASLGAEENDISRGMRALSGGFLHAPYPHPYRSPFGPPRPGGSGDATVDFISDHMLFHAVMPDEVAGVVIEPLAGSGGVLEPPATFWQALRELCDRHGWMLCVDEVKTGIGRTGSMFAIERSGIEPDLMCLGKALGGGVMPIGALLGSERAMGAFDDVCTGSTWSWLPAACAAALAVLDAFEREDVLGHVRELEAIQQRMLMPLLDSHRAVGDVRVRGCFSAIELVRDRETKERDSELQEALSEAMLARGVYACPSTTSLNIQPSLTMAGEDLERVLGLVLEALDEVVAVAA